MNKTNIFLVIACGALSLLSFTSCTPEKKQSEELHKQVEAFHDEVMPEMSKLYDIRKSLDSRAEALTEEDSLRVQELQKKSLQAKSAEDNMMNWMRDFSQNYDKDASEEEKVKFLKNELQKIEKVNLEMKEALKIDPSL